MVVFVLLGPPGAGKGTQAIRLSEAWSMPHVSTGDLFRENRRNDTELGRQAREYMDAGKLVPDDLVIDMLFDRVAQPDCERGYLLDGYPRTIPQAEALTTRLGPARSAPGRLAALELKVPDAVVVERLTARRTCEQCSTPFHLKFDPPAAPDECDRCGGKLVQRADDTEETVLERLRVYQAQTAPLSDYYESRGQLVAVDGDRAPDEVFQALLASARGAVGDSDQERSA